MKERLLLVFFSVLFGCLCLNLEKDANIIEFHLNDEKDRTKYTIKLNQTTMLINSNGAYIYFVELPKGIEAKNLENNTFKELILLPEVNSTFIIYPQDESGKDIGIYVTSILNDVKALSFKNSSLQTYEKIYENAISIIWTEETKNQIMNLNSLENSVLFYIKKYDFNDISPKDLSPFNKTLFKKYDGNLQLLEKNSVYILYTDIYKLNDELNIFEIFISLEQENKTILLQNNLLYLKKSDDYYNISFPDSNLTRVFKLSRKANGSEVTKLEGETILNSYNRYYELKEKEMKEGIQLKVTNDDCLLEILFLSKNDSEILDSYSLENYKLTKTYTIIKIPKNKCRYDFKLSSKNKNKLKLLELGLIYQISKNNYFYNFYKFNIPYDKQDFLLLVSPYLYNAEIDNDEYEIYEIVLDKNQLDNDIYLTYNPFDYFQYLLKEIDEKSSEYIIGNISSILQKFYIYKDIAKKPPQIKNLENYHHKPIDLIKSLSKISRKNRTYLGLYQDIHEILTTVRDYHLNIILNKIEDKFDLELTGFCSPFELYIETRDNVEIVKMKSYSYCINFFNNKNYILKYLEQHSNIALKSINGTDPFDFIQNFGKYQTFKNRHAQFIKNLDSIKESIITVIPFDYSDILGIEYEFENGDIIKMDYLLYTSSSFTDIDQKGFEEFYHSLIYNQTNPYLIPNLFQAKALFQQKKGLLFEETPKGIKWDFETQDKYLKCRVDNVSHYNVFLQTSFSFKSLDDAINVMVNCSKLFYSNDYKIIGIENKNGGGIAYLYEVWHQLLQQKTLDKTYKGLIRNKEAFDYFRKVDQFKIISNLETCKYFGSLDEMGEDTDDYGTSEVFQEDIKHNRTKAFELLDKTWRKRLEIIRKNNFNKTNLKNPTDILIYTDAYCFSTCSGFIKAFQNTGGAIIVGFNGNPKIEGTNEFDGSQSSSSVASFKSQEYYELEKLGYHVYGITYTESFDDSYRDTTKSPIPREYTVDLVDRRVPIYSQYSDDIYDLFISNAKNIFNEFENEKKCSKNNDKLLLDDENCKLEDHKKGGHPCGTDGKWNLTDCKAYYCELGYYYDQFQDKCVLDVCTNRQNEKDIYANDIANNETKEYNIKHDEELVFHLENDSYYYFLEGNDENIFSTYYDRQGLINSSKLCIVSYSHSNIFDYVVNVNYFGNLKENATIRLTKIEEKPDIIILKNIYTKRYYLSNYLSLDNQFKIIISLQTQEESIIYLAKNNDDIKMYYLEYNFDVTPQEIINIEPKKFTDFSGEILNMKKDKTYIFIYKSLPNIFSSSFLIINPKNLEQNISISDDRFLYLNQQNLDYKLDFKSNSKNIYIKLDSLTLNAEIEILEKNEILNKDNRYFLLKNDTQKLTLRNKNNNPALIEFLYELKNVENLDTSKKEFKLKNKYYMLKYKKSDNIKSVKINLESSNNILSIVIHGAIGKDNYLCVLPNEEVYKKKSISSEFTIPNDKLINDDETFNILLRSKTDFTLKVELNKNDNDNGLPLWALIAIIVGGVILTILIIFIILRYCRKGRIGADSIEKGTLLSSYDKEDD